MSLLRNQTPLRDALTGALAGAAGVLAMDYLVTWPLYLSEDKKTHDREKQAQIQGKWAAHASSAKMAQVLNIKLSPRQQFIAGKAAHFLVGILPGALYALLKKRWPVVSTGRGLAYGTGLFLLADELATPALGIASGPTKYPWQAHARGFLGHLALGFATDLTLQLLLSDKSKSALHLAPEADNNRKKSLANLSSQLKDFHKELMKVQSYFVESFDQRKYNSYDLLQMCIHDNRFAWLKKLSNLITRIDHRMDEQEKIEILDIRQFYDESSSLLNGTDSDFKEPYQKALLTEPHLYMKQAEVLAALSELQPKAKNMHEMHVENEKEKFTGV